MDTTALNNISYGLYVLTAAEGGKLNGCIINTLSQVTSSPVRVSITVNKANYTCDMIKNSGSFNVSMLDQTADFSVFKHFGFASGRDTDKFTDHSYKLADNGIPFIPQNTCAYLSGKVTETIDLGTHLMFIADVTAAEVLSDKAPMTYAYYHANVKPKPQPQAQASEGSGERWICNICGYIYEGHLPDDFICPLCKHGAADFSLIEDNAKKDSAVDNKAGKWVCSVCGYIYEGDLPEDFVCPICGVGADQFNPL